VSFLKVMKSVGGGRGGKRQPLQPLGGVGNGQISLE